MKKGWQDFRKISVIVLIILLYLSGISALFTKDFLNITISIIVLIIGLYFGYFVSGKRKFKESYKHVFVTGGILFFLSSFLFFNHYNDLTIIENLKETKIRHQLLML